MLSFDTERSNIMKARISPIDKLSKKEKEELTKYISQLGYKMYQDESQGLFRRYCKLTAVALNKKFGFGANRIKSVFDEITEVSKGRANDEIFWRHIDKIVREELKMNFPMENYEDLDK